MSRWRWALLAVAWSAISLASAAHVAGPPLWFVDGKLSRAGDAFLEQLDLIEQRGLRRADYDGPGLRNLVVAAERTLNAERVRCADEALSDTAGRVASDLQRGRVSPRQVGYELDLNPALFDRAGAIRGLATSRDVAATLDAFEPQLRHYKLLKDSLRKYRELALHPEVAQLPVLPSRSVKPGDTYAGMPALRQLLLSLGDLSLASGGALQSSTVLDDTTSRALAHFQMRVGIDADGVLGNRTYHALTVSPARRVEQIELTMERIRWLPRELAVPPIIVNIPQFRLFAFRTSNDFAQDILQMNVIVGATFDGRETPVFSAQMRYVVLNPYWDVPYAIMKREQLPEIEADSGWVARNHFQIVDGQGDDARVVPVTAENVRRLARGSLRLRQEPGPGNALGRVKFMFPNRHNVYLHDTPAHALFAASRRAFSHGCIRVADPMALLAHVLRDDPQWTPARIAEALEGPPATRIALLHPIPVFILYGTALATEAGDVLFFEDIYAQDAKLARLLATRSYLKK
jgi:murein L,D-transpeptidase YcbB/YkuD